MIITIVRTEDGFDVLENNKRIGFVEDGQLFAFNNSGYSEFVSTIEHSSEIVPKLKNWSDSQQGKLI